MVLLDDAGYGDLGCYGQPLIQTPKMDRVAAEGMRFTDCYAGGVVCGPARSVLMTGFHTGHTPIRANAGTVPIALDDYTIAQALKGAGYATGGFGKWGLGDAGSTGVPSKHGFDEFFGYLHQIHAHSYYPEFLWDNEKKFPLPGNLNGKHDQYSADLIAERSFQFLRKHKDQPFFLYCCYTLPHAKFEIPSVAPYENKSWTQGQKTYAAMMTRADSYVGRIMAMLKEFSLDNNTIVFVSSDNGAHSGSDKGYELFKSNGVLRGEKAQLYEGGIRIPMIARWPGKIKPGVVSAYPWAFCDFFPTAAEVAGARIPPKLDGISVLPVLTGTGQPKREFLYWESDRYDRRKNSIVPDGYEQAVRMGDWKAIRHKPGAPLELYNLHTDVSETTNVAAQNPAVIARIEAYLKTARTPARPHNNGSFEFAH
jgi:arylsulfatase A